LLVVGENFVCEAMANVPSKTNHVSTHEGRFLASDLSVIFIIFLFIIFHTRYIDDIPEEEEE